MGKNEIHLDGSDVSIIKALGITGGEMKGQDLMSRVPELLEAELIDTLKSLMMMGYIVADRQAFYDKEGLEQTSFHVNSGYAKELKDAMDPRNERPKSKRVRRE